MRIFCESMAHPKRLAKRLTKATESSLHRGQVIVARLFGYHDWHELEQVTASKSMKPSLPDRLCSHPIILSRKMFQLRVLQDEMDLSEDAAYELLQQLEPTNNFHTVAERERDRMVALIFPKSWDMTLPGNAEGASFLYQVANEPSHVGPEPGDYTPATSNLRLIYNYFVSQDVEEGYASVGLRLHPTIDEQVVVAIDIEFIALEFTDKNLVDKDDLVETVMCYLNSPLLSPRSKAEMSGLVGGIDFRLNCQVTTAEEFEFVECLARRLIVESKYGASELNNTDPTDEADSEYRCCQPLPVRSVASRVHIYDDLGFLEMAGSMLIHMLGDDIDPEDPFGREGRVSLRERLIAFLKRRNQGDLTDFLQSHDLGTEQGIRDFAASVRAVEKANAVTREASLMVRHYLSHAFAEQDLEECDDGKRVKQHVRAAVTMGDTDLAEYFSKTEPATVMNDLHSGAKLLLSDDQSDRTC